MKQAPLFFHKKAATLLLSLFFLVGTIFLIFVGESNLSKNKKEIILKDDIELWDEIKKIPAEGLLNEYSGLIYLEVSEDFYEKIYPLIVKKISDKEKECLQKNNHLLGPHIPLIRLDKNIKLPGKLRYPFEIENLYKLNFIKRKKEDNKELKVKETWYALGIKGENLLELLKKITPDKKTRKDLFYLNIAVSMKNDENNTCIK